MKPKLWDGANAVGEAKARELVRLDAPFLSASGPGFETKKAGPFVAVMGPRPPDPPQAPPQFAAIGVVTKDGVAEQVTRVSSDYRTRFAQRDTSAAMYAGPYRYTGVAPRPEGSQQELVVGAYTLPGVSTPLYGHWDKYTRQSYFASGVPFARGQHMTVYVTMQDCAVNYNTEYKTYYATAPDYDVLYVADDGTVPTVVAVLYDDGSAVDSGGVSFPQPYCLVGDAWAMDFVIAPFPPNEMPSEIVRRWQTPNVCAVGGDSVYAVLLSEWMFTTDHTTDVSATARVLYSDSAGGSWQAWNVSEAFKAGMPDEPYMKYGVLSPPPAPPAGCYWSPPLEEDYWETERGPRSAGLPAGASTQRVYLSAVSIPDGGGAATYTKETVDVAPHALGANVSPAAKSVGIASATSHLCPIGENEALWSHVYCAADPEDPEETYSPNYGSRMFRLAPDGAVVVWNAPGDTAFYYFQSMVYLGKDRVLAKCVHGFDGTDFDVSFRLSADRGETWELLETSGLPSAKNQHLGNLTLVLAYEDADRQGVVLMPAWVEDRGAYCVFASEDCGATWERKATIAKSDVFHRVDQMLVDDGGGNFASVRYYGTQRRPAPRHPAIDDFREPQA